MTGMDLLKFCFGDKITKIESSINPHYVKFDFGKGFTAEVRDVLDQVSLTLYVKGEQYKKEEWLSSQKEGGYDDIAIKLRTWEIYGRVL